MISAIVYTSNSGYTAEYARLLGRATGLPVNDLRQVHTPQPDEEVIFLGWLMADRVMGWPKANAFFKVLGQRIFQGSGRVPGGYGPRQRRRCRRPEGKAGPCG